MTATYPAYVGDVGYPVTLPMGTVLGTVDLVAQEIRVVKPDKTTATWTATVADTTNITYPTIAGDFSVKGDYLIQPYGEYSTGEKLHGPTCILHVYDPGEPATVSAAPSASSQIYTTLKTYCDGTFLTIDGLIIEGDAPPTVTPAFVGQRFIDKTNKKSYEAYGTASSADWGALN